MQANTVIFLLALISIWSLYAATLTIKKINKKLALPIIAISVKSIELAIIRLSVAVRITPKVGMFRFSLPNAVVSNNNLQNTV